METSEDPHHILKVGKGPILEKDRVISIEEMGD